MPAKKQVPREAILAAAFAILRKDGFEAVNARNLANVLKCSTQPIYLSFRGMEELREALYPLAENVYQEFIRRELEKSEYPPYKAGGMAYIRFAKEEKHLFKLLFMRERSEAQIDDEKKYLEETVRSISAHTGMDLDTAYQFHLEMWFLGHGIATMLITSYFDLSMETVSEMLTDAYKGLKWRCLNKKQGGGQSEEEV